MKIKITSDSTIDIPDGMLEKHNISIIPFNIILGDRSYLDRIDCTPPDIYKFVSEKNMLPKTAAINPVALKEFFEPLLKEYDAIIHIPLSSGISATYDNAVAAASQLENVYVLDGRSLSTGTALLALYAADLVKQGLELDAIIERVESARDNLQVSFVVDTMEYLYKGGRCSGIAAFFASKLNIKPTIIMHNSDGKMRPGKKYMAKIGKAMIKYVDDIMDTYNTPDLTRIFITHTDVAPDIVAAVKERVRARYDFKEVIETIAGSTITSHCGKGTLGILYINKRITE